MNIADHTVNKNINQIWKETKLEIKKYEESQQK